jgi:hypothetical protein
MSKGEDCTSRALMTPFLAIHAKKGEKWAQSKRTAPPPNSNFKNLSVEYIFFNWYPIVFKRGRKIVFQKYISKPSWTLRGGSLLGGVLFSQRKSIWNRGRKFQILKMLYKILFIYLWLFAKKNFEKDLQNGLQKQNSWCKRGPKYYIRKKHSMHIL